MLPGGIETGRIQDSPLPIGGMDQADTMIFVGANLVFALFPSGRLVQHLFYWDDFSIIWSILSVTISRHGMDPNTESIALSLVRKTHGLYIAKEMTYATGRVSGESKSKT